MIQGAYEIRGQEAFDFIEADSQAFVYDPRKERVIPTDNPILIFADLIKGIFLSSNIELNKLDPSKADFWKEICDLADMVEE